MLEIGRALLDVMQQDNDSQMIVCIVLLHDFQCFAYTVMLSITLIGCFHFVLGLKPLRRMEHSILTARRGKETRPFYTIDCDTASHSECIPEVTYAHGLFSVVVALLASTGSVRSSAGPDLT